MPSRIGAQISRHPTARSRYHASSISHVDDGPYGLVSSIQNHVTSLFFALLLGMMCGCTKGPRP